MKLKTLAEKYKYKCYWCGGTFPLHSLTRDHIKTASRGGKLNANNLVLSCLYCNRKRGEIPFYFYKQLLKENEDNYYL